MTLKAKFLKDIEEAQGVAKMHMDLFAELGTFYKLRGEISDINEKVSESLCNYLATIYKMSQQSFSDYATCKNLYSNGEVLLHGGGRTANVAYDLKCTTSVCSGPLNYLSMIMAYNNGDKCAYQIVNFNPATTEEFANVAIELINSYTDEQAALIEAHQDPMLSEKQLGLQNDFTLYANQLMGIPGHVSAAGTTYPAFTTEQFKDGTWIHSCGSDLSAAFPLTNLQPMFTFYQD